LKYPFLSLNQVFITILTNILENDFYGPILRADPSLIEYAVNLTRTFRHYAPTGVLEVLRFLIVFALEPGSPECFDAIIRGLSGLIRSPLRVSEIEFIAHALLRLSIWPSFTMIGDQFNDIAWFIHENFFNAISLVGPLVRDLAQRGISVEEVFQITVKDITEWASTANPGSSALAYGLFVLEQLFLTQPPESPPMEFVDWAIATLPKAGFLSRMSIASVTLALALKCEPVADYIIWSRPDFWEASEELLADAGGSPLVRKAMELFMNEFKKSEERAVGHAIVGKLVAKWEYEPLDKDSEPVRVPFMRTFARLVPKE
jgi:hypothetical protein